jgi:hypothetical protein
VRYAPCSQRFRADDKIASSAVEAASRCPPGTVPGGDVAYVGLRLVDRFYDQLLCLSAVDGLCLEVFEQPGV